MSIEENTVAKQSERDATFSRLSFVATMFEKGSLLISFVVLIAAVEFILRYLAVPSYVFPTPSAIFKALWQGFAAPWGSPAGYYIHIRTTLIEALAAFVGGGILGVVAGTLITEFRILHRIFMPYIIGLQSVPKVALAPLFVVWFGFGVESKILLGVLLTFFPLLINTAAGMANVDRDRIELMQSLKASAWKTFRIVKLPGSMPYIFAGLEMAAVYSILGAVVGEFVGGNSGLGVLILNRNAALDIAGSLAALVILAVMGILLQRSVVLARRRVLFWAPSNDSPHLK